MNDKKMQEHECFVGVLNDYDDTRMITFDELFEEATERIRWKQKVGHDFTVCGIYGMDDYTNKRKSTDLDRFNFCPICGKKIDMREMMKERSRDEIDS